MIGRSGHSANQRSTKGEGNPACRNCGERLLRWGWYEAPFEPVEYWYCLECDLAGREPCIQVHPTRKEKTAMAGSNLICGIDPMGRGAIAYLDLKGGSARVVDMPVVQVTKSRAELDIKELWIELLVNEPRIAFVEKMQAMPKGGLANFKLGAYRDALRMAFQALGVSLVEVPPKDWQREYKIRSTKDDDTKAQSYLIASRMFPEVELRGPRGAILDGRADALLIAEYGRRVMQPKRAGAA